MALNAELSRGAKILVGAGLDFEAAQAKLGALSLDVVVGRDVVGDPAAQAAVLTAVSVGLRSFVGGVRVFGAAGVTLALPLPLGAATLDGAAAALGAHERATPASRTIVIGGTGPCADATAAWFDGWRAGYASAGAAVCGTGGNPLSGAAAGALAVGAAFRAACGLPYEAEGSASLWNPGDPGAPAPPFGEVFLPNSVWLLGLGNLGQAYLWALSLLPYADPADVELTLQDADRVGPQNWGTSVLVRHRAYGDLKTRIAEDWALGRGFRVRRVDRRLAATDRLAEDDPRVAFTGFDSVASRRLVLHTGFEAVIDAGLGRTAEDYDRYRVNVFDREVSMERHLEALTDPVDDGALHGTDAYRRLEREVGQCGMLEIAGAAAAAPYVSALAATVAATRLIQLASGCEHCSSEVGWVGSRSRRRTAGWRVSSARGVGHAGRPAIAEAATCA